MERPNVSKINRPRTIILRHINKNEFVSVIASDIGNFSCEYKFYPKKTYESFEDPELAYCVIKIVVNKKLISYNLREKFTPNKLVYRINEIIKELKSSKHKIIDR